MAFSKFKAWHKKAAALTAEDLWAANASGLPTISQQDRQSYFLTAGYLAV
jgi:hypothetical protein